MTDSIRIPQRRTPIQERARATRQAILEATAQLLSDPEGPDLPSTNRIAKVAGVSIGTLYQYFDRREAIFDALAREHAADMLQIVVAHAGPLGAAPPREAIPGFIEAMVAAHAHAPRLHLAMVRAMLGNDAGLLLELQNPSHALVRGWLEAHRDEVRPKDLGAAASLLTHTVEAAIHGELLVDPARLQDPAWRAELIDLLLRYLLD